MLQWVLTVILVLLVQPTDLDETQVFCASSYRGTTEHSFELLLRISGVPEVLPGPQPISTATLVVT